MSTTLEPFALYSRSCQWPFDQFCMILLHVTTIQPPNCVLQDMACAMCDIWPTWCHISPATWSTLQDCVLCPHNRCWGRNIRSRFYITKLLCPCRHSKRLTWLEMVISVLKSGRSLWRSIQIWSITWRCLCWKNWRRNTLVLYSMKIANDVRVYASTGRWLAGSCWSTGSAQFAQHCFKATPLHQTVHSSGCPYRRGFKGCKNNLLQKLYPTVAQAWDHEKMEGMPDQYSARFYASVWWSDAHGSWKQDIHHLRPQKLQLNACRASACEGIIWQAQQRCCLVAALRPPLVRLLQFIGSMLCEA